MKNYEDIAERVFEKGDEILKRRQKRTALIRKTSLVVSEICAGVLICFGIWKTGDIQISMNHNFPDTVITESESATDSSVPVSTAPNNDDVIYASETVAVSEPNVEQTTFPTGSAPENIALNTSASDNAGTAQLQTLINSAETHCQSTICTTFQMQTNLQTVLNTTEIPIPIQTTVCTTIQTENEGSIYMKKLTAFSMSAITIAASITPMIGNAEYKIDESRYWLSEKAMFAKMESGEFDVDINEDGEFDVMDGYTLFRYAFSRQLSDNSVHIYTEDQLKTIEDIYKIDVDDTAKQRIESIADYNRDGIVDMKDAEHLIRYLIVSKNVTREQLEPTYYDSEYFTYDPVYYEFKNDNNSKFSPVYKYIETLDTNLEYLLAKYYIVAEACETDNDDWAIDLDFNGNGQLDVGDIYVFNVFMNIKNKEDNNAYISDEEWDRCDKALWRFPCKDTLIKRKFVPTSQGGFFNYYWPPSKGVEGYHFMYYLSHYIVAHTELKSEYFTEEYYAERYGENYYCPESWITSAIVEQAADYLGVEPGIIGNAEYKIDESRYREGEKEIFAKMESGELDVDINGDGKFDEFDGFMLHCYIFNKSELTYNRTQNYYTFDKETSARIDAIADYNGDGKINSQDRSHLERYFIVKRNLKKEHLYLTYYDPEYIVDEEELHPYDNAVYGYVMSLRQNMKALLAGYDIMEEMYEDGTIDFDFNGNGQLDVGDVYTLNVFYNLYNDQYKDQNNAFYDIEYIENSYISEDEWNRCNEAQFHYPNVNEYYPIFTSYYNRTSAINYLLFYSSRYIAAHTEMKSEYFTEEYYAERYGENYYRPESGITSARVRQAAEDMGIKANSNAWIKYNVDDLNDLFISYCRNVESGLRPAPDVNMDGVVDLNDYFVMNTYLTELIADKTSDNSILSAEIWNNISENFDINGNGTTKDIYDILAIQMYVIKYTDTSDFDAAYKRYQESCGENSIPDIEDLSFEKKIAILADIESKTICGDANCDGEVTIADAAAILQYLGNNEQFPLEELGKSNAGSCDGVAGITAKDALTIQLYKAGLAKLG